MERGREVQEQEQMQEEFFYQCNNELQRHALRERERESGKLKHLPIIHEVLHRAKSDEAIDEDRVLVCR